MTQSLTFQRHLCAQGSSGLVCIPMADPETSKKKPAGRPKLASNEVLDIQNLYLDWNSSEELRDRLLDGKDLLDKDKGGEDIPTCVANLAVLQPLVTRMSLTTTRPLPAVEALRIEIENVYIKCKCGNNPEDQPDVAAICWRVRKLLGFVKMKVRRREVSSVPSMQIKMIIKGLYFASSC